MEFFTIQLSLNQLQFPPCYISNCECGVLKMKYRYNVALIPRTKSSEFIDLAKNFYHIAGEYKLGVGSQPHITLCQFMASESECESFWGKICESSLEHTITLSLVGIEWFSTDSTNWIFLRPNRLESLMKTHCIAADIIETRMGKCFENYDAHMTLVNTDNENFKEAVKSQSFEPIQDEFVLTLGLTDAMGQYKKVLHQFGK
jgi:2'-5' RNA ligase